MAAGVAQLFQDHMWKLHGLLEEVISDQGMQFISNFTQSLSKLLGIWVAASMAHHPQTDWLTERVNQEVEQFLQLFVNQCPDDWYEWLSINQFAYNNQVHASTNSSPFMVDTGQNPQLGIEPLRVSCLETLDDFASKIKAAWKKHAQLSPGQQIIWPISMMAIGGSTFICGLRQSLAQQAEHHYDLSNEEIRPQVAWSILSWQGYIMKCVPTQTTVVIWLNPCCILNHPATTLQCKHHCRKRSTWPSTSSHSWWSQRIWSGTYPRQLGLPWETRIPCTLERIWHQRRQMETIQRC